MENTNTQQEMVPQSPEEPFDINKFKKLLEILKARQEQEVTFKN
jgi:hypothetical protein